MRSQTLREKILRLLVIYHQHMIECDGTFLDLGQIASSVGRPRRVVREACNVLEATGLIEGLHALDDYNPSHDVTDAGKAFCPNLQADPEPPFDLQ